MLSRIFWVGLAGMALVIGMVLQDGDRVFHWADERTGVSEKTERAIAASVEHAIDGSFDGMQVMDGDGNEIDVPPETKRALGEAVGRLVKAKADLAILKVRDASEEEMQAAEARSAQARADVDRLKAEIRRLEQTAGNEREVVRQQIQREVRDEIRETIQETVEP